jgi:hypothetical protein
MSRWTKVMAPERAPLARVNLVFLINWVSMARSTVFRVRVTACGRVL